jgi:3,4-dihydroxy-2-butanone 4-phosphate synthase
MAYGETYERRRYIMTYEVMLSYKTASLVFTDWEDGHVTISDIFATDKRKGHATGLLSRVVKRADDRMLTLLLEVVSDEVNSMSNDQLERFYEKFGFVTLNVPQLPVLMERKPKIE